MSKIPQWKLDRIEAQRQHIARQQDIQLRKACERGVESILRQDRRREAQR